MHEREAILQLFQSSEQAVLATVVEVKGSAYRRPGARMLLTSEGKSAGVINGGCLDADLQARARTVQETRIPQLAVYDSTSPEDIVFGLGLGCRGVVKILLEPARNLDFLRVPDEQQVVAATVFEHYKSSSKTSFSCLGTRAVWRESGSGEFLCEYNDLPEEEWAAAIASDAQAVLGSAKSLWKNYETESGIVRAYIELLSPPQSLIIFGAGADAVPLASLATLMGWNVKVIDMRAPSPDRPVFVEAVHIAPRNLQKDLEISPGAACVIMTHNFLHDLELLKRLLPSAAGYIGILGPRQRTDELLGKLSGDTILPGIVASSAQMARLFAPVGLDLGAETPEEIALSIVSEIQKIKRKRSGQSLRETLSIH